MRLASLLCLALLPATLPAQNSLPGVSEFEVVYVSSSGGDFEADTLNCRFADAVDHSAPCSETIHAALRAMIMGLLEDSACQAKKSLFEVYTVAEIVRRAEARGLPMSKTRRIERCLSRNDAIRLHALRELTGEKSLGLRRRISVLVRFDSGKALGFESHSQFPFWLPWIFDGQECYSIEVSEWVSRILQEWDGEFDIGEMTDRAEFEDLLIKKLDAATRRCRPSLIRPR